MKRLKVWLYFLLSLFIGFNLLCALGGISSVMLTATVYFIVTYALVWVVKTFVSDEQKRTNVILALVVFFGGLFITELTLKYVAKKHLSYEEKDGNLFYESVYRREHIGNFVYGRLLGRSVYDRIVNAPNDVNVSERKEFQYPHHYNELGLRGVLPDTSAAVLLCGLGDSFTDGRGAPEDSAWIILLAKLLNTQSDTCCKYYGLNGGAIGSDPVAEYQVLLKLLETYSPEHVFVAVNETDIYDVIFNGGNDRYDEQSNIIPRSAPWFDFFYGFSFIARTLAHDVFHYNYFLMADEQYEAEKNQAIETLYECISNYYVPLAEKSGFKLWVIFHPSLGELENNSFELKALYEQLKALPDVHTINLFDAFKKRQMAGGFQYQDLYWIIDSHHNSKGYALWAECMAEAMKEL